MKYGSLILEKKEYVLLKRIMNVSYHLGDTWVRNSINKLNEELQSAMICDEPEIPEDVVRFNSKVTVSFNEWEDDFYIVPPAKSDLAKKRVSVMAPMGAALIGYSKGDEVVWDFPNGSKLLLIKAVCQEDAFIDNNIL